MTNISKVLYFVLMESEYIENVNMLLVLYNINFNN